MQTPKKSTLFAGQYLRNRSNLDIGVLGYIGIVLPKEHSPEVWSVPPVTPCIDSIMHGVTIKVLRFVKRLFHKEVYKWQQINLFVH